VFEFVLDAAAEGRGDRRHDLGRLLVKFGLRVEDVGEVDEVGAAGAQVACLGDRVVQGVTRRARVVYQGSFRACPIGAYPRAFTVTRSMGIDLNEHAANSGETFDPSRTGLDHLAFGVSSYDALVSWAAHLDGKGVAHSQIQTIAGVGETFDFRDPDGIQLELWHHDHKGAWASTVQQKLEQSRPGRPAT
jgi:hypothetical protein